MIKYLIASSLLLMSISCRNRDYVPRDIIKPAQMQSIFWDMMRGDILVQEIIKKDSTQNIKSAGFAITEKIFAIHKTDRAKFEKSMAYYEKHPVLIKTIFDSLNAIQSRNRFSTPAPVNGKPVNHYHLPKKLNE